MTKKKEEIFLKEYEGFSIGDNVVVKTKKGKHNKTGTIRNICEFGGVMNGIILLDDRSALPFPISMLEHIESATTENISEEDDEDE